MLTVAALSLGTCRVSSAAPHADGERERLIRGALLYKFAKFVEWPEGLHSADSAIQLCVLGDENLASLLQQNVAKLSVRGHAVEARSLAAPQDARACHVVYFAATSDIQSALRATDGAAVLTVASQTGFLELGGMINLVRRQETIGFEINLTASRKAGLALSSRLREVAVPVETF